MGTVALVPALSLSKLSKLGLVMTAVGQARGTGEVGFALQDLCSPACSCHVCDRNSQGSELSFSSVSG